MDKKAVMTNVFGEKFRVMTWGESHGKAIGAVIDGCPAGLELDESDLFKELEARRPGYSSFTSPRKETDYCEILSGVFEGKTTGAPISLMIRNQDADSSNYKNLASVLRPGHANYTFLEKYGIFDYRGGGRASARETACRVAAGAVALKLLKKMNIEVVSYLSGVGELEINKKLIPSCWEKVRQEPLFCPDVCLRKEAEALIESAKEEKDSLGGRVGFCIYNLPTGLGEPLFNKSQAVLGHALLSLPAVKGFELGEGFQSSLMKGSVYNDVFVKDEGKVVTKTNHQGGMQAGVTNGMPVWGQVAFKPISSIKRPQETLNMQGDSVTAEVSKKSRHDPCTVIRAVPIVRSMCALAIADLLLCNMSSKLSSVENLYLKGSQLAMKS
jgi:chorismate synthase